MLSILQQPLLPRHVKALEGIYSLYNGGNAPKTGAEWSGVGLKFTVDGRSVDDVPSDKIVEILVKMGKDHAVRNVLEICRQDPTQNYYIYGDRVVAANEFEIHDEGSPASMAYHYNCLFRDKNRAVFMLEIVRKIHSALNGSDKKDDVVNIRMIKTHPDALDPKTAYEGTSAAFDLASVETITIPPMNDVTVPVGLKLSIDEKDPYYMQVHMRSSFGFKHGITCHQGIIDAGYTGDFGIKVFNRTKFPITIHKGEYFAQVLVHKKPKVNFIPLTVEQWDDYESKQLRGRGGFGSSNK